MYAHYGSIQRHIFVSKWVYTVIGLATGTDRQQMRKWSMRVFRERTSGEVGCLAWNVAVLARETRLVNGEKLDEARGVRAVTFNANLAQCPDEEHRLLRDRWLKQICKLLKLCFIAP